MGKRLFYFVLVLAVFFAEHVMSLGSDPRVAQEETFKKIEIINERYVKNVKPIFVKSCFDCHSSQTRYPWYHSLPLIKSLLDNDIAEGKKHLNMSDGPSPELR